MFANISYKLGNFLLSKNWQVVFFVLFLVLLPFPAPIIAFVSIALITLRQGVNAGLPILIFCSVLLVVAGLLLHSNISYSYMLNLLTLFGAAVVLRITKDWTKTLLVLVFCAISVTLIENLLLNSWSGLIADFIAMYKEVLEKALAQNIELSEQTRNENLTTSVELFSSFLYMSFALTTALLPLISLILARYWQSYLFMPNEFGKEFRSIRIMPTAAALLIALTAFFYINSSFSYNLVLVLLPLIVAGISLIHFLAKHYKWRKHWIVLLYVLLLTDIATIGLVLLAIIDSIVDFRNKLIKN